MTKVSAPSVCAPARSGTIEAPIGRDRHHRTRMSTDTDGPRDAVTHFEVERALAETTLLRVRLETGRTHQIRVHLAAIGCPVLCDGLYSGRAVIEPAFLGLAAGPPLLSRQALHAERLGIAHPVTGEPREFAAPLPADIERMLAALRLG